MCECGVCVVCVVGVGVSVVCVVGVGVSVVRGRMRCV